MIELQFGLNLDVLDQPFNLDWAAKSNFGRDLPVAIGD